MAIPSLSSLLKAPGCEVAGVVSLPDRPSGRRRRPAPPPLKAFAQAGGLYVLAPEKIESDEAAHAIAGLKPDLFIVVAYGQRIPRRIVALAPHEALNVHPSLLPKYRGAAPVQWAVLNGDHETGVSVITLNERMDTGDILKQQACPINPDDTAGTLYKKMARLGAELLLQVIAEMEAGTVQRTAQCEDDAVKIRKLTKADGAVDWSQSAHQIHNRVRAFNPWPGSYCMLPGGDMLKIWKSACETGEGDVAGKLLDSHLLAATGEGALRLLEVQIAGGHRMPAEAFLHGHPIPAGRVLT